MWPDALKIAKRRDYSDFPHLEIYLFVFILVSMYRFVSKSNRNAGLAFHASGFRSDALRCFRPAFALFFATTNDQTRIVNHYFWGVYSNKNPIASNPSKNVSPFYFSRCSFFCLFEIPRSSAHPCPVRANVVCDARSDGSS